jgi:hypothetical protein
LATELIRRFDKMLFNKKVYVSYIGLIPILIACSLIISLPNASAEDDRRIVSYNCDTANDQIIVEYLCCGNEKFNELKDKKLSNVWYPWDLVTTNKSLIIKVKEIIRTCVLSDGKYKVTIGPEPGNWNILGEEGASMAAWVKISKNGKEVIHEIMEHIWDRDMNKKSITSKIIITAKKPQPIVIKVTLDDFYK